MAINFLDNVQFNQNQLLGARLENVTSDPTSASGGDIIFNSTTGKFKYYDGTNPFSASGWIDPALGGISGSGTIGTIPIFVTNTTTIGNSPMTTTGNRVDFSSGIRLINGNIDTSTVAGTALAVNMGLQDKDGDLGTSGQLLSSTGAQVNWIDAPVSYTKWILSNDASGGGSNFDINDGDTFDIHADAAYPGLNFTTSKTGTVATTLARFYPKNIVATNGLSDYTADFLIYQDTSDSFKAKKTLAGNIPVSAWGQATAAVDMGDFGIVKVLDPVNAQDAATKNYVDSAVAGGLNVKGGFNANTGVTAVAGTNLYTNTAIAIGDYYTVTVAGNFFGQASTPLTPGDSVLVQTAAASGSASITDFAVIQSDTDLATATTVGIGNVNVNGAGSKDGLSLSYASGTATAGLDITSLPRDTNIEFDLQDYSMPWYNAGDDENQKVRVDDLANAVNKETTFAGTSSSGTSHVFTHNLGSLDVIVQLYETSTQETVFAKVDRTSTNVVTVTTTASANIRCLIQRIGSDF